MVCGSEYWGRVILILTVSHSTLGYVNFIPKSFECGPYGFICEGKGKLRLCEGDNLLGPAFRCPPDTICNEDSSDVCESAINYLDPAVTRTITCRRNERIGDPSVPGCKGYILCIPNKNRFQGIKFKCSGNTIFNGYTRTCSAPDKYKCPLSNNTKAALDYFGGDNRRISTHDIFPSQNSKPTLQKTRPINCKNYKFRVTQDDSPVRATYFCPSRPIKNGDPILCTVFSNQYCITLEREDEDQFVQQTGAAYRRPRYSNGSTL